MAYFWHEAILESVQKRASVTEHRWLAGDGTMSPVDFEKKPLVSEKPDACESSRKSVHVQVKKCEKENGLRSFMTVVACISLKGKMLQMKVVEDFESRPHKAVSSVAETENEMQE